MDIDRLDKGTALRIDIEELKEKINDVICLEQSANNIGIHFGIGVYLGKEITIKIDETNKNKILDLLKFIKGSEESKLKELEEQFKAL